MTSFAAFATILFASLPFALAKMPGAPSFDHLSGDQTPLVYSHACDAGETLTVAAVGDFLFHSGLQTQADRSAMGYRSLWLKAQPLFDAADVRYGNLEGPVAPGILPNGSETEDPGAVYDGLVYSSFPRFNYPAEVATALSQSHISIVSTANNHAMDRTSTGADATIETLRAADVKFVGTRTSTDENPTWFETTEAKGFKLAWVACSFSTNGNPDKKKQVLGCFSDTELILNLVHRLSQTAGIDAVIVTPHWGVEYQAKPNAQQLSLGKKLMDAGALAVIGTHPHVLEPWEKYVSADGKEHFLIYSTGNFISGEPTVPTSTTIMVQLQLGRNAASGTFIRGVGYVAMEREKTKNGSVDIRPLLGAKDQAPPQAWTIWNTFSEQPIAS